jgi:hypothetical protein
MAAYGTYKEKRKPKLFETVPTSVIAVIIYGKQIGQNKEFWRNPRQLTNDLE